MKILNKYTIVLIAFIICQLPAAEAQTGNFSLYDYTPFLTNPGMIGRTEQTHFTLNTRIQPLNVGENLTSTLISGYFPIRFENQHKLVIAASFKTEQAASLFDINGGLIGLSYAVALSQRSELSFGAQGGYFLREIGGSFVTDNQITGGIMDPAAAPFDPVLGQQTTYPTISSGIFYRLKDGYGKADKAFVGVSFFNMMEPNRSFVEGEAEDNLPISIKAIAGYKVYSNASIAVSPIVRWINQADINAFDYGANIDYTISQRQNSFKKMILGLRYNSNSVGILTLAYEQERVIVGAGYDLPMADTGFNEAQNGIFELAVTFKLKRKNNEEETTITKKEEEEKIEFEPREVSEEYKDTPPSYKSKSKLTWREKWLLSKTAKFNLDSDVLTGDTKDFIDNIIAILKDKPAYDLRLVGHTCNLGEREYNGDLGMERAESVRDYMVSQGISADRLETISKGETEPLVKNINKKNRQKNRRVEFEVISED
ncbi:hypothetical protein GCM10011506_41450 [Marivirga lumbricoides]|uniref:OmpA-like domain-containing protein n=1 Tax=Marivirga lumbricoides TaxID=1046115 RepID=A0ABQ1N918_9BACT|nr:hypothetical protein GCM10011506_41450 [Marivirga lumbricoides]